MIWFCSYTDTFYSDVVFACGRKRAKKKVLKMLRKRVPDLTEVHYHETGAPVTSYEELIEDIDKMSFKEWWYLVTGR